MKMLVVSVLVLAMMALTSGAGEYGCVFVFEREKTELKSQKLKLKI